jgi:hypothetical protein
LIQSDASFSTAVHKKIGVKVIKRSTMATVVALLALVAAAAPAMATTEEFVTSYALGPGAFASGSAHTKREQQSQGRLRGHVPGRRSRIRRVHGDPNSGGNFTAGSNCGTGDRIWNPSGTSCCTFHGAVWNQTLGVQAVTFGRYTW